MCVGSHHVCMSLLVYGYTVVHRPLIVPVKAAYPSGFKWLNELPQVYCFPKQSHPCNFQTPAHLTSKTSLSYIIQIWYAPSCLSSVCVYTACYLSTEVPQKRERRLHKSHLCERQSWDVPPRLTALCLRRSKGKQAVGQAGCWIPSQMK